MTRADDGSRLVDRRERRRARRSSIGSAFDWFFFVFAGLASIWLATLSFTETFRVGWWGIPLGILFWVLLAYLVLPRLHRILTTIYVPDYFIGRARTSHGLLGDPINLALMGDEERVHAAMAAARWTRADPVTLASSVRIVTSTLARRSYHEAPVSPLFLFGRQQDFAYQQEVHGNPAQRHHVRFWRCPPLWRLPGGRRVDWLAAGTFDTSVGLSLFTLQVTHRIDADTDVERDHIVQTLSAVPGVAVDVIEDFSSGYHARNGGGDSIRTDGDLPIIDVSRSSAPPVIEGGEQGGTHALSLPSDGAPDPVVSPRVESVDESPIDSGPVPFVTTAPGAPVAKRAAFESPSLLLSRPEAPRDAPRPFTVTAGVGLVVLRALAGILWLVVAADQWRAIVLADEGAAVDRVLVAVTLGFLGAVTVTALVLDVVLAAFVFAGRNWARIVLMVVGVVSISSSFVGWWTHGGHVTVTTTLLTIGLDILVIVALSSRSAAAWSRRERQVRRDRGARRDRRQRTGRSEASGAG